MSRTQLKCIVILFSTLLTFKAHGFAEFFVINRTPYVAYVTYLYADMPDSPGMIPPQFGMRVTVDTESKYSQLMQDAYYHVNALHKFLGVRVHSSLGLIPCEATVSDTRQSTLSSNDAVSSYYMDLEIISKDPASCDFKIHIHH